MTQQVAPAEGSPYREETDMQRISRAIGAGLLALTVAFTAAACGESKPSKDELRSAMMENVGSEAAQAEQFEPMVNCMVDELHANVSAEGLRAMIDQDESYDPSDEDEAALKAATEKCMTQVMEEM